MHMSVTIRGGPLSGVLTSMGGGDWRDIGNGLRDRVINRTRRQHVDADMRAFEPYSEGYKKTKAKKGGMIGGGPVDLTGVTAGARMLDNMMVISQTDRNPRILIRFALADKARLAQYHMEDGRVLRKFFALSDDDIAWVMQYLRDRLAGRQNRLFR